jgi:hypothetical protein
MVTGSFEIFVNFYQNTRRQIFTIIIVRTYRPIILPVVLYGCESWSLTLREECRLRVFENKVLRMIFGPKRDEVTGVEKTA